MDCEKFDLHVIDALYDELDELTFAAMKRHMDSCSRCAGIFSGLRATREVGVLPLEEPSEGFEARILEAATAAQRKTPWPRKALRALAWAGSHAMRPQLAMAALFVLVIGSSLLLLRAKPGMTGASPYRVTERGVPAPEAAEAEPKPAVAATAALAESPPPPIAAAPAADEPTEGLGRRDDATKSLLKADKNADEVQAQAALATARAAKSTAGCSPEVAKQYDGVGTNYPSTKAAAAAMWEAAQCYRQMNDVSHARQLYVELRTVDAYKDRAESALAETEPNTTNSQAPGGQAAAAAAARAPAAAAPAKQAAAKPARAANAAIDLAPAPPAKAAPGSTGKAPASPAEQKRSIDSTGF